MVYDKDFDSAKEKKPQQGGRFASAEDNKKNKQNTAKKEGKPTYQVLNADGSVSTFNTNPSTPVQNYNAIFQAAIDSGYITKSEAEGISKGNNDQAYQT